MNHGFPSCVTPEFSCCIISINMELDRLVSIDLGTTNSTGHMFLVDGVNNLDLGDNTLFSSSIQISNEGLIACHRQGTKCRYVRNFKRLLGKTYNEYRDMKCEDGTFGCEVGDDNGNPFFKLRDNINTSPKDKLSPEEAASLVIQCIMERAKFRRDNVDTVIMTIPANYSSRQKKAVLNAVKLSGYKCYGLLPEPTAAALSYLLKQKHTIEDQTLLVYDFGGGTFDVSLLEYRNNKIRILQTDGDIHLGGSDIDAEVMKSVVRDYKEAYGQDLLQDGNGNSTTKRASFLLACQKAKEELSSNIETNIELSDVFGDDFDSIILSRVTLNECTKSIIDKTWTIIERIIEKENNRRMDEGQGAFGIGNIKGVLLVGGSSKLPGVRALIDDKFGKNKIVELDCYQSVGIGAFLHVINMNEEKQHISVQTALDLDIGLGVNEDKVIRVFEKTSNVPCSRYLCIDNKNEFEMKTAVFKGSMDTELMVASRRSLVERVSLSIPKDVTHCNYILLCELKEGYFFALSCLNKDTREAITNPVYVVL